jgi:hypothetical protein
MQLGPFFGHEDRLLNDQPAARPTHLSIIESIGAHHLNGRV